MNYFSIKWEKDIKLKHPILWKNDSSSFNKIFQIVTIKSLYLQIHIKIFLFTGKTYMYFILWIKLSYIRDNVLQKFS